MGTIAEKLEYLEETKLEIASAIQEQDVEVPPHAAFREYADLIRAIRRGDISDEDLAVILRRLEDAEGNISVLQQTSTELDARVTNAQGGLSELRQTVDGFTFAVSEPTEDGNGLKTVTLSISMGGNTWSGVVAVDGNLDISGSLSASALYAAMGDIAKLTVDSLSTSRRIPKFLARDTSPDEYIRIEGKVIRFITAETDGSSEQARDPDGRLLFWEQNVSGAALDSNGMPCTAANMRVFTTTSQTDWPVYVYRYNELQKIQLKFMDTEYNEPLFVFGAGIRAYLKTQRGCTI